jgi:hypothetical protein
MSQLRLQSNGGGGFEEDVDEGQWLGLEDLRAFGLADSHDEMLQLDIVALHRGRTSFAFSLRRQEGGTERASGGNFSEISHFEWDIDLSQLFCFVHPCTLKS